MEYFELFRTPRGSHAFIFPHDKFVYFNQALHDIPTGFGYSYLSSEEAVIYLPTNIDEPILERVREIIELADRRG